MLKHIRLYVVFFVLLSGCSNSLQPADNPASTLVAPAATQQIVIPSPNPTASQTPYPSITRDGQHIFINTSAAYRKSPSEYSLLVVDLTSGGRKEIKLPENSWFLGIDESLSPNGQWLALVTGDFEKTEEMTLSVFEIETGELIEVSRLLSDDYAANLREIAESLPTDSDPNITSAESWLNFVEFDLKDSITYGIAWSPDSNLLAFSSQYGSVSSELNIYDLRTQHLERVTHDLENLDNIYWSPQGNSIAFTNSIPALNYPGKILYLASFTNDKWLVAGPLKSGHWWNELGWVSDTEFLTTNVADGCCPNGIKYLDTRTLQFVDVWPGLYITAYYSTNNGNNTYLVYTESPMDEYFDQTRYEVEIPETAYYYAIGSESTPNPAMLDLFWQELQSRYSIIFDSNNQLGMVTNPKLPLLTDYTTPRVFISGSQEQFAIIYDEQVAIYTSAGEKTMEIQLPGISWVIFIPDDEYIYLVSKASEIYKISSLGEVISRISPCLRIEYCSIYPSATFIVP